MCTAECKLRILFLVLRWCVEETKSGVSGTELHKRYAFPIEVSGLMPLS